jgi:RNA polymerase sigma-70 factor (ECF subfamily)
MSFAEANSESTSTSLIERLRADPTDQAAWNEFITLYTSIIRAWADGWRLQPADADDLVQTVISKLLIGISEYKAERPSRFRSWLRVVTRNAWLDLEARRRTQSGVDGGDGTSFLLNLEAKADFHRRLEESFDTELLEIAMSRVKARIADSTWEAFRLSALEGLSGADVGARIGMPIAHVFVAKHRVIKLIREELENEPIGVPWMRGSEDPRQQPS